jgi:hypothetical protein
MSNEETIINYDNPYILSALRRKKENPNLQELCFRQIVKDMEIDLNILKARISKEQGIWRIYRSVNRRDLNKAFKHFQHKLIDGIDPWGLESEWKSSLCQTENKAEKKFLIDIDNNPDQYEIDSIKNYIVKNKGIILEENRTPNGYHIITIPFDSRDIYGESEHRRLNSFTNLEIKKDALFFLEIVDNSNMNL